MGHFLNMFYRSQMDTNGNFSRDNDYINQWMANMGIFGGQSCLKVWVCSNFCSALNKHNFTSKIGDYGSSFENLLSTSIADWTLHAIDLLWSHWFFCQLSKIEKQIIQCEAPQWCERWFRFAPVTSSLYDVISSYLRTMFTIVIRVMFTNLAIERGRHSSL